MRAPESPFESYKPKRIFVFRQLIFPSVSGPKALKKGVCVLAYSIAVKSYRNIFEIGLKKCGVIVQKSLSKIKYFEINNSQTRFCSLFVKLATVQI